MGRVLVQQPGTNTAKALSETLPKNVIIVDEGLKELRLHDGVTPGGKIIGNSTGSGVPVGTIIPFAGTFVPQGYLLCDGSVISRTDYAALFAVIGTIYGAGDGNSTFNLPNIPQARLIRKHEPIPIIDGGGILALEKVFWYYSDGSPMTSSSTSAQYFAASFGNNFILDTTGHGALGPNSQTLYKSHVIDNNSGLYAPMCIKYI